MEVINRKSIAIKNGSLRSKQRHYVAVTDATIYFTASVVRELGLSHNEFVHFMNEGDKWQFFVNDDEDGFRLTPRRNKGGLEITNSALCKLIQKSTGYTTSKNYFVVKTGGENDKCPVYELKGKL